MKKTALRRIISVVLSAAMMSAMMAFAALTVNAEDAREVNITIKDVVRKYSDAAAIIDGINAKRAELGNDFPALTIDSDIEEESMIRAAELPIKTQSVDLRNKRYDNKASDPDGDPESSYAEAILVSKASVDDIVNELFSSIETVKAVKSKKACEIGVGVITINDDTATKYICVHSTNEKTNMDYVLEMSSSELKSMGDEKLDQETVARVDSLTLQSVSQYNGMTIKKDEKVPLLFRTNNYDGLKSYAYLIPEYMISSIEIVGCDYYGNIIGKKAGTANVTMMLIGDDCTPYTEMITVNVEEEKIPLVNESAISSESVDLGKKVTLTGNASGGKAPYSYAYFYKKHSSSTWITLADYSTETSAAFKPGSAVPYDLKVSVKDADGNSEDKEFGLTVINTIPPLVNNSTVSSLSVAAGETVTLNASAEGGVAPYTYALMYKKASSSTWIKIGTKYGTEPTGSFTPGKAVPYDIMINVKDKKGKIVSKSFKLDVTAGLKNTSSLSASTVKVGESVTLNGSASGGTAPYTYALMYKKASSSTWVKIGKKYGTASTGSFTPGKAVPYDIMINVRDSSGTVKTKSFKLEVTA